MSYSSDYGYERSDPLIDQKSVVFIDRVEASGAKIEETLDSLNITVTSLFFIGSLLLMVTSTYMLLSSITGLMLNSFIVSSFLIVFGFIIAIINIPGMPRWASVYRQNIYKNIRLLSKITGKSLALIFCSTTLALMIEKVMSSDPIVFVIAAIIILIITIIGLITLCIGIQKSLVLERVKKLIQSTYRGNAVEIFRKYAITDPLHGLQYDEFSRMCSDYSQGTILFDAHDIGLIYNCLDGSQKGAVNEIEFVDWITSRITYL